MSEIPGTTFTPKQQHGSIESLLRSVFGAIRRRPGAEFASPTTERIRVIAVGSAIIIMMFFLMLALQQEIAKWGAISVAVPLPPEQWKVALDSADCGGPCIRGPDSPLLEKASLTRGDPTYRAKLASHGSKPVWTQIRIPKKSLDQALATGATVLFLGRIYAPHQIWINGQALVAIHDVLGRLIFIDLREDEWNSADGLSLSLRFENTNHYAVPELTQFEVGTIGFTAPMAQEKLANQVSFADWARPLTVGLINLLVTLAFFAFWRHDPKKQEFLWFAGYTLILGATQILTIPALVVALGEWNHRIKLPLHAFEVGYALILGFSFIRSDPRWPKATLILLFVVGAISSVFALNPTIRLNLQKLFYYYGAVIFAAGGAFLCLGEIWFAEKLPKHRQRRLVQFSGALILVSALYAFNASGVGSTNQIVTFQRFAHLGLVLVLATIVFTHFREITDLANSNPLSRFHRDPELLGRPVFGLVMNFDLKGSGQIKEHLPNKYAETTARAISAYRMVWLRNGGIETSTIQGDGLKVLFPIDPKASENLLGKLLSELFAADPISTQILKNDGLCPPGWEAKFRALFAYGSVTPITTAAGSNVTPQWLDGENTPLFASSRLEEIEKEEIDPGRAHSLVLISEDHLMLNLSSAWTKRRETRPGKEGRDLSFFVIEKSDLGKKET